MKRGQGASRACVQGREPAPLGAAGSSSIGHGGGGEGAGVPLAVSALSRLHPAAQEPFPPGPPAFKQGPSAVPALGPSAKKRRHGDEDVYYMHVSVPIGEPRRDGAGRRGATRQPGVAGHTLRAETRPAGGRCVRGEPVPEPDQTGRTAGRADAAKSGSASAAPSLDTAVDDTAPGGRALGPPSLGLAATSLSPTATQVSRDMNHPVGGLRHRVLG